jgi:hypothetical protein
VGKPIGKKTTGKIMLNESLRNRVGGVGVVWIYVASGRERWRVPVNAVKKFRILSNAGNFVASQELVDYQQ